MASVPASDRVLDHVSIPAGRIGAQTLPSPAQPEPKLTDGHTPRGSCTTRTFSHAGLGNMPCDSVARKSPDLDGFSRAAANALGVGRREALGVRQLAAALS